MSQTPPTCSSIPLTTTFQLTFILLKLTDSLPTNTLNFESRPYTQIKITNWDEVVASYFATRRLPRTKDSSFRKSHRAVTTQYPAELDESYESSQAQRRSIREGDGGRRRPLTHTRPSHPRSPTISRCRPTKSLKKDMLNSHNVYHYFTLTNEQDTPLVHSVSPSCVAASRYRGVSAGCMMKAGGAGATVLLLLLATVLLLCRRRRPAAKEKGPVPKNPNGYLPAKVPITITANPMHGEGGEAGVEMSFLHNNNCGNNTDSDDATSRKNGPSRQYV